MGSFLSTILFKKINVRWNYHLLTEVTENHGVLGLFNFRFWFGRTTNTLFFVWLGFCVFVIVNEIVNYVVYVVDLIDVFYLILWFWLCRYEEG